MKHFKITKNNNNRKPFILEVRVPLPKPKLPLSVFWNNRERRPKNQ